MKTFLMLASVVGLSACSSLPKMPAMPKLSLPGLPGAKSPALKHAEAEEPAALPKAATAREHVARAIELLDTGDVPAARASLAAALSKSPNDATALSLSEQIEKDPVALLGARNEPYVVAAGDTMSGLADRFLDDPLMFYALSRYNGLASPKALAVGRTLKIPIRPGAEPGLTAAVAPPASAAPANPVSAAIPLNAAKASVVRLQALELLNGGDVARAVSLLTEAQAMDGTNAAIAKDLERARRIQSALNEG